MNIISKYVPLNMSTQMTVADVAAIIAYASTHNIGSPDDTIEDMCIKVVQHKLDSIKNIYRALIELIYRVIIDAKVGIITLANDDGCSHEVSQVLNRYLAMYLKSHEAWPKVLAKRDEICSNMPTSIKECVDVFFAFCECKTYTILDAYGSLIYKRTLHPEIREYVNPLLETMQFLIDAFGFPPSTIAKYHE